VLSKNAELLNTLQKEQKKRLSELHGGTAPIGENELKIGLYSFF